MTSRPRDLFVLLQLVGHPLGRSFLAFAKRYCAAERNDYGWQTRGASNIEELTVQLHGVMLRRSKDDVLALPPKLRTWLPVDVPQGTGVARHAKGRGADGRPTTEVAPGSAISDLRLRGRLLAGRHQGAPGAGCRQGGCDDRLRDRRGRAGREGDRLLLFRGADAEARRDISVTRRSLLTGKTPAEQAPAARRSLSAGRRVSACSSRTSSPAASALNLTAATQVVFNDLDWVPANHWQAEDRAYRIGQTRTVNVTYMVAGNTIDDFVRIVLRNQGRARQRRRRWPGDCAGPVRRRARRAAARAARLSSGLTAADGRSDQKDLIDRLLERARQDLDARLAHAAGASVRTPEETAALARALESLAKALSGTAAERYRFASASHPGVEYEITVTVPMWCAAVRDSSIAGSAGTRATSKRRWRQDSPCRPVIAASEPIFAVR